MVKNHKLKDFLSGNKGRIGHNILQETHANFQRKISAICLSTQLILMMTSIIEYPIVAILIFKFNI